MQTRNVLMTKNEDGTFIITISRPRSAAPLPCSLVRSWRLVCGEQAASNCGEHIQETRKPCRAMHGSLVKRGLSAGIFILRCGYAVFHSAPSIHGFSVGSATFSF